MKKNQKGFSLLGVIIAMFITMIGLVSILNLSINSLKAASYSKARLIASGLAQEGMEIIQGMRKSNINWDDWYDSVSSGDYRLQYDSSSLLSYSYTPLRINSSGLYQYDESSYTPFYRKISLDKISNAEVKVVVEVSWDIKGERYSLIIEDRLWNWK
ncbi:MAG: prepilin-type N-terminal cleavage/methylation domain-containing protein [bacterium]